SYSSGGVDMSFLLVIIGLVLLVKSADYFVDGCSDIAKALGIPTLIIGLTIVSFGTSAPEAAISITASLKGDNAIVISNAIGSNICNLLLVLGVCGVAGKLVTKEKVVTRDYVYAIFAALIVLLAGSTRFYQGSSFISRTSGLLLLGFLCAYVYTLINDVLSNHKPVKKKKKEKMKISSFLFVIFGLAGIIIDSDMVVKNAQDIAEMFNISHSVVTISLIDIGTSLPELITSLVAVKKGETDLAIGNVVGSNIFNLLFVLALSAVISPVVFTTESLVDIIFMFIVTIIVYILILKNRNISKKEGIFLLSLYVIYLAYVFIR
ncbi:MAG: calcium/sodium antiporter, partial [Bacilli bacterium]|nr:calcium/sodium antiporter [Bacilli bacterium]